MTELTDFNNEDGIAYALTCDRTKVDGNKIPYATLVRKGSTRPIAGILGWAHAPLPFTSFRFGDLGKESRVSNPAGFASAAKLTMHANLTAGERLTQNLFDMNDFIRDNMPAYLAKITDDQCIVEPKYYAPITNDGKNGYTPSVHVKAVLDRPKCRAFECVFRRVTRVEEARDKQTGEVLMHHGRPVLETFTAPMSYTEVTEGDGLVILFRSVQGYVVGTRINAPTTWGMSIQASKVLVFKACCACQSVPGMRLLDDNEDDDDSNKENEEERAAKRARGAEETNSPQ